MQLLKITAALGIVTVLLSGCGGGGGSTTTTTTTMPKECKPATDTDECLKNKGPGTKPDAQTCKALGPIGCGGANCTLTGTADKAHCESCDECKSMTKTDPCFKAKGPGSKPNAQMCKDLGAIGCWGANCTLMGEAGSDTAHCMSPMEEPTTTTTTTTTTKSRRRRSSRVSKECKPMTEADPCFKAKGPGMKPNAHICTDLGAIGCGGANCTLMGDAGSEAARCMSPLPMSTMVHV